MFHLAILLILCAYASTHMGRLLRHNIVRFQLAWLSVIFLRFLVGAQFDRPYAVYVAYYAFWMVVFWAVCSMAETGRLSAKQVAVTGTIMNALMSARLFFFFFSGKWIGMTLTTSAPKDRVTDQGYILLWFLLMQLIESIGLLGGIIAIASIVGVVLSLERGALISLFVGLLVYTAIQAYLVPRERKRIMILSASSLIAIGLAIWMSADQIAARWLDLANPKTAGSGRLNFWSLITDSWMNSGLATKVFGAGPLSTQDLVGTGVVFAHNDFLEQLHCFGIVGVLLLAGLCCVMLGDCYRLVRSRSSAASVFCAAVAIYICTSLYCIVSYSTATVWFAIVAGTMLASAKSRVPMPVRRTARSRFPIYRTARPAASLTG
jgi:hypothetical protein